MSAAEVVVIALAIILKIALLSAAVFVARRIDRDEPGPTIVRRRYSDNPIVGAAGNGVCCGGASCGGGGN